MSAEVRFHGVLKLLVKIPSPNSLIEQGRRISALLLSSLHHSSPGQRTRNTALVRITHFPELDKTTEFRICGWMERALEISGCKEVKVEIIKSLTNFQPVSEYDCAGNDRQIMRLS